MKKFVAVTLAVFMMCSSAFAGEINVSLNGENVEFASQEPVIVDGRTLIPLRGVFEKLGYEIGWDNDTKTATFVRELTIVKVTVNASEFTVDGKAVSLDVPAQIINGSMMLPLRAVGEATGLEVSWDGATKTVDLKSDYNVGENLDGDFEFSFDKESGMAELKPKSEITTEATTEIIFEEKTETTTKAAAVKRNVPVEQQIAAQNYVLYTETAIFSQYYMAVMGEYNEKINSFSSKTSNEEAISCLEEIIAVNDAAQKGITSINDVIVNHDLLNAIITTIDKADKFYNILLKNYKADTKNKYSGTDNAIRIYNESLKKQQEAALSSSEKFLNSNAEWNWSYDELSNEELIAVNDYQKKVGEILKRNLGDSSDFGGLISDRESLGKAAKTIREEVTALAVPERCLVDSEILIMGTKLAEEGVEIGNTLAENDPDRIYPAVLILTFDICAKNCAGDYYS